MGHYDSFYENVSVKDIDSMVEKTSKSLELYKGKLAHVKSDIPNVHSDHVKELLKEKIESYNRQIAELKNQLTNWEVLKEQVKNGKQITLGDAITYAKRGW